MILHSDWFGEIEDGIHVTRILPPDFIAQVLPESRFEHELFEMH
ncbi:MAG: hypothetical protein Q7U82_13540 [Gammaproteobacteria bacterium]|nr:hypothetical protein [Gammaproteobacteria bacterium]